jgi:hypothetical protein
MIRLSLAAVGLAFAASLASQDSRPATKAADKPVVAVLGASLSAGFSCSLMGSATGRRTRRSASKRALAAVWPMEKAELRDYSDLAMFTDPIGIGTKKSQLALRAKPEIVVAVDFLFWFGYGHLREGGDERAARLARLAKGEALLDAFDCPILVGDIPDMTGADERMLSPRQIPSPEIQKALNESLRAWAKRKPNVRVYNLADHVLATRERAEVVEVRGRKVPLSIDTLLQDDKLHPTRLGVALLVTKLLPELALVLPKRSGLQPGGVTLADLVETLGVEVK